MFCHISSYSEFVIVFLNDWWPAAYHTAFAERSEKEIKRLMWNYAYQDIDELPKSSVRSGDQGRPDSGMKINLACGDKKEI